METALQQESRFRMIARNSDIAMSLCVIGILVIMIMPLPTWVLDILLSCNITVSVVMILVSMYVVEAINISVFPSFLLISTLFRLALNISSTRLILLNGDQGIDAAGQVIKAFGSFVVGGNYVVGAVVFAILIIINTITRNFIFINPDISF